MKTLMILLAPLLMWSGQETVPYTNPDLNLTFSFPKNWTVQTKKNEADIFFPLEGSEEQAKLEIRAAVFFSASDTWQEVQAELAKSTRRELVKQWEDQLLGVPLLLTSVKYTEEGVERTRQTGLMYGATRKKLVYHLTAPTKVFEQAETTFKAALQSMRTIDGVLPKPETPGRETG